MLKYAYQGCLSVVCSILVSCFFILPVQAKSTDLSRALATERDLNHAQVVASKDRKNYNKHYKKHHKKHYRHDRRDRYYRDRHRHHYRHGHRYHRYDDRYDNAWVWGLGAALMTGLLLEQNAQRQNYGPSYQCYVSINGRWYKGTFQSGGPCYVQYGNQWIASDNYRIQR